MPTYETKDGIILRNVPEGTPESEIKARIQAIRAGDKKAIIPVEMLQKPTEPVVAFSQTKGMSQPEQEALRISKLSSPEQALQGTALGLNTLMSEGAQAVAEVTPEPVKSFLAETTKTAMGTPVGMLAQQAMKMGGEVWADFSAAYPRFANNVEALATVGSVAGVAVPGVAQAKLKKFDFLDDVVTPYSNKKNRKAALGDMKVEGILQRKVFPTTAAQAQMKKALMTVPGIKKGNINSKNYQLIKDHNLESAVILQRKLDKANTPISPKELRRTIEKASMNVDNSFVKSKRLTQAERLEFVDDTMDLVKGYPKTTGGLLEARKAVDKQFRAFSNQRRMDGQLTPTRDEIKWRNARDSLNALLEMKEPGYRAEIRRQHQLYKAMDTLEDKAEWESNTFFGRNADKVKSLMGIGQTTIIPKITK